MERDDSKQVIDPVQALPVGPLIGHANGHGVSGPSLLPYLESLLFVADVPVSPAQLAAALQIDEGVVQAGLEKLEADYAGQGRGLRLQRRGGRYLLVTMPEAAAAVEAFLNLDLNTRLSTPALETLAIVAYRQPVTRAQIEAIRGVDCGGVLRTLINRELIEESGRLESVGRPILYAITDRFMQHFGLTTLEQLPPLPDADVEALWAAGEDREPDAE